MHFSAQQIPYQQTNKFSKIVLDYLENAPDLQPFFSFPPNVEGLKKAIEQKKKQPLNRPLLVKALRQQYQWVNPSQKVETQFNALLHENTFTVCTAHQPNLLTGPLYFIYKILHTIKLADYLQQQIPGHLFVPVFFMGSEDADLEELNHFYIEGKKYEWDTRQKGAVGRMQIDEHFIRLSSELEGQISGLKFGAEILELVRKFYRKGARIQEATFGFVHALFAEYGLVVLIPDSALLKQMMLPVFMEDLFQQKPSEIVTQTSERLAQLYNAQAYPRAINLFYLKEHIRERIVPDGDGFAVHNTDITFTRDALEKELQEHPERFSPNVILRGLFQEAILPNIAFIGGGGELAYWLQLKDLFDHYQVMFPVLVLRNSFLLVEEKWKQKINKLGFKIPDFFQTEKELIQQLVIRDSSKNISLNGSFSKAEAVYEEIKQQAEQVDRSLVPHVAAIKTRSLKILQELEKKMLRAEKRKFAAEQRQIQAVLQALFPNNGLQERKESILYFYALHGNKLLQWLYDASLTLEQEFVILEAKD